jgi:hypothetical protein
MEEVTGYWELLNNEELNDCTANQILFGLSNQEE